MPIIYADTDFKKEPATVEDPLPPTVRWIEGKNVQRILAELSGSNIRFVHFEDPELFADANRCLHLCVMLRQKRINILWSARMRGAFGGNRLRFMRMSGCRKIVASVDDDTLLEFREEARKVGLEYVFIRPDGSVLSSAEDGYTVEELEAVAKRLPGVHSVEFDLAVAQFMAGNYDKVKEPLAKSVALSFPASELSLNLAACLQVALEHPEVAEGRSVMKGPNSPAPVIMRNRRLVRSWLENGSGFKGQPILLEPCEAIPNF